MFTCGKLRFESWFGLFAPAATPDFAIERLTAETAKVVAMPDVAALFAQTGGRMLRLSGEPAKSFVHSEVERWTRIVREAKIAPP